METNPTGSPKVEKKIYVFGFSLIFLVYRESCLKQPDSILLLFFLSEAPASNTVFLRHFFSFFLCFFPEFFLG